MNNICKDICIYFRCHSRTFRPDQSQAVNASKQILSQTLRNV